MKFLKLFKRRRQLKKLAEYEKNIIFHTKTIEASEVQIKHLENYIVSLQTLVETSHLHTSSVAESRLACYLPDYLKKIESHYSIIKKASAEVKYYEVLRDNLKKELNI